METAEAINTYHFAEPPEWLPKGLRKRLENGESLTYRGSFSKAEKLVLKKRIPVAPSVWMPKHRVMSTGIMAGSKWSNDITPYSAGIMDASFFPGIQTVIVCATPQTSKSETINNCIGYMSDMDPGPAMMLSIFLAMSSGIFSLTSSCPAVTWVISKNMSGPFPASKALLYFAS